VQELATAVSMKLDLTILILKDDAYGMIKWKQVTFPACIFPRDTLKC
jgi:thiamine pyrophosphate-dependent acetolactate synthase large subunit-like protein